MPGPLSAEFGPRVVSRHTTLEHLSIARSSRRGTREMTIGDIPTVAAEIIAKAENSVEMGIPVSGSVMINDLAEAYRQAGDGINEIILRANAALAAIGELITGRRTVQFQ